VYWPHFGHIFLVSGQGRTIPLMKRFRFARLRLRVAAIGWLGIIISLSVLIWDFIINADFLVSKWPQKSRPMPAEMWVFFGSLLWLLVVAFWPELDKSEQPDLALVWDWPEDNRPLSGASDFSKSILVHNRSEKWIYNVEIHPIKLSQEMTFEMINEVEPQKQHLALARWGVKSSMTTQYIYFFGSDDNERAAMKRKWIFKKVHNRGLSDVFLKIPMRITYEADKRLWESRWTFIFDVGSESLFERVRDAGSRRDSARPDCI